MKTIIKQITCMLLSPVLAAVMILGTLSMLVISCGDDSNSTEQTTEQMYQNWTEANGLDIGFIQKNGVSPAEMDAFIAKMKTDVYTNALNTPQKITFATKVTKIYVNVTGAGVSHSGTELYIGHDASVGDIYTYLNTHSFFAKIRQKVGIMLANAYWSPKAENYKKPGVKMNENPA